MSSAPTLPQPEREKKTAPLEQIVKLEKEMSQVHTQYKDAEQNYSSDLLNLVVAKGYLNKLLANAAVVDYIGRHEPEILEHLQLVVNTVSMEEAVQQTAAKPAGSKGCRRTRKSKKVPTNPAKGRSPSDRQSRCG
jgi:hypothetical protein